MKKLLLLFTIIIISSCKKNYRCNCWIANQPHSGSPEAYSIYATKKKAPAECKKKEQNYPSNAAARECKIVN